MAQNSSNKKLISELISQSTGFQTGEENFQICLKYAASNLRFHRYLDVDRHKVKCLLNGLYEKFTIHSAQPAREALKKAVSAFLNKPEFEKKNAPETDTHYSILSFLLEMSSRPTSQHYSFEGEDAKEDDINVNFDWYKYLTEDLDPLPTSFSDSSVDSEASDIEETIIAEAEPFVREEEISQQVEANTAMLRELLVDRYWAGEDNSLLLADTDFAHDWNGHLRSLGVFESFQQDTYMTEYQMVREVIWMLSGATESFLFLYNEQQAVFSIKKCVKLTHTTKTSLAEVLIKFTRLATKVSQLRQFVTRLLKGDLLSLECQTYQAFSVACTEILTQLDVFSHQLSHRIQNGDLSGTLISILQEYNPYQQIIHILHTIYTSAICPNLAIAKPSVSTAATQLLITCNSLLNEASLQAVDTNTLTTLTRVFVRTLAPYLHIIDEWLTNGNLNDPYLEFVIKKKNSKCLDETFWDMAVELTTCEPAESTDRITSSFSYNYSVPELLKGTLTRIAISGKSMEMLAQLGKVSFAVGESNKSLLSAFVDKFCSGLNWGEPKETPAAAEGVEKSAELTLTAVSSAPDVSPLLHANFRALFEEGRSMTPVDELRALSGQNMYNMVNLGQLMSSSLELLVEERYNRVSQCLLHVLKDDCHIYYFLSLVRKVYLLEAGDIMYEFLWELFDKIRLDEDWKDVLTLNVGLHECLEKHFPKHFFRFSISLADDVRKSEFLPIHMLEKFHLHYEVDWPIDVIYNSACEEQYNRIFQFLLQLKLAKHSIDNLKFDALHKKLTDESTASYDTGDELLEKSIYLLRMKILHAVNSIHDYIMTTILYHSSQQFEKNVEAATDLEMIMMVHRNYLNQVFNRCFLHPKNAVIHGCLLKILNTALIFQKMWDSGLETTTWTKVEEISLSFTKCIQILMSFITSLIKTGSLPHLESLALAFRDTTAVS